MAQKRSISMRGDRVSGLVHQMLAELWNPSPDQWYVPVLEQPQRVLSRIEELARDDVSRDHTLETCLWLFSDEALRQALQIALIGLSEPGNSYE